MIANVSAKRPPPPIPCNPRAMISCGIVCAAPHSADATTNDTIAISNSSRRPYRSLSLPNSGVAAVDVSRYAVPTHV